MLTQEPWHDVGVLALTRMVLRLVADLIGLLALAFRPRQSIEAENLIQGARSQAPTYRCRDSLEPCLALALMRLAIVRDCR